MPADLLARLKTSPVLCDGAMGTLLYSKGIFINRCYDELNLSQPDLIRGVHHEYLQAGAEIVETNTFGGNSFRLERHGLGGKVHDINFAGAKLAKEAAKSFDAWVAGSVGPLGIRIEPLGKTSFQEAKDAFREQIAALLEGGVDLIILETFGYLEELHQALLAARELNPKVPVIAQVTVDEEANCLDGSTPETFAPRLEQWGADVIGCNCSVGPVAMLDAMERVRAATSLPVSAQPNAGIMFAGIHGELCQKVCRRRSQAGRRVLWNHAGTHSRHEVWPARKPSPRQDFRSAGERQGQASCCNRGPAPGAAFASGRKNCERSVRHHG